MRTNIEIDDRLMAEAMDASGLSTKRETVEARNQTEAMVHQGEKNLRDHGDKLATADKGEAEAAVNAAKAALEGTDGDAIKQAGERLSQAAMKIGETLYKAEQAAGAAAGAAPGADTGAAPGAKPGRHDDVVDAEFEEVDDKKKKS